MLIPTPRARYRVHGNPNNFPTTGWISNNGVPPEDLQVGSQVTVAGAGNIDLWLGLSADTTNPTHTVSFNPECGLEGSGIQVGDRIGPFSVLTISSSDCPDGTALGCGLGCNTPDPTDPPTDPNPPIPPGQPAETTTSDPATTPPAAETTTVTGVVTVSPEDKLSTTTLDPAVTTDVDLGAAVRIATGATGTQVNDDVEVCFPYPSYTIIVDDIVTIEGDNYVVKATRITNDGMFCVRVTEQTTGELSQCLSSGGCNVDLHTQSLAGTIGPTDDTLNKNFLGTDNPKSVDDFGRAGGVCTFALYPESNGGCDGAWTEQVNITSSVGFLNQECRVTTSEIGGSTFPLYLTAQPVCNSGPEQEWSMCSWQPDPSSTLCGLTDQECCNYIVDYVEYPGDRSIDIACQQYREGDCATVYGFDGTSTRTFSARLLKCEGPVPTDPQCPSVSDSDTDVFGVRMSSGATSVLLLIAILAIIVAMSLRKKRLKKRKKVPGVTAPLLTSSSVANLDYEA